MVVTKGGIIESVDHTRPMILSQSVLPPLSPSCYHYQCVAIPLLCPANSKAHPVTAIVNHRGGFAGDQRDTMLVDRQCHIG